MKKKKNKKKKIGIVIVCLLGIIGIGSLIMYLPIKNIYVKGNQFLSDQEIIELAGIEKYPKLFSNTSKSIENKIKISPFIENVKVEKNLFGELTILIKEYQFLLKDQIDNTIYLSNLKKVEIDEKILGIPSLVNYVDESILNAFLSKLNTIDKKVLSKISEIEYTPNEYDKDLFLFYMNDGNYVYITTTRLLNINKYENVLKELDGKKGILYLDSGNHFEILD